MTDDAVYTYSKCPAHHFTHYPLSIVILINIFPPDQNKDTETQTLRHLIEFSKYAVSRMSK